MMTSIELYVHLIIIVETADVHINWKVSVDPPLTGSQSNSITWMLEMTKTLGATFLFFFFF